MMTVGMLGSVLPTVGGTYRYPSRLFSARWASVGVWCYALALVFGGLPLYATQCIRYLQALWPAAEGAVPGALAPTLAAVALLTVFWAVNLVGISIAAGVQAVMAVVFMAALLVFGLYGVPGIDPARFEPLFTGGAGGFILAACILTFALQGSNAVIELGAEIKRPTRNIPLSLLISIPVVAGLYVLVATAAVGNVDLAAWKVLGENANLSQPAAAFLPKPLFYFFIIGGAFFAFTTTINGTFMWATKSLMVISSDGIMPERLARTSRFGTPALFLTVLWAGSCLAVVLDGLAKHFLPAMKVQPLNIFANYATIGGLIVFIPVMIAAILLPRRVPEVYQRARFKLSGALLYAAPIIGIVISVLLIVILLVDLKAWSLPFIVWFGLGFLVVSWRKAAIERESGEPLSDRMARDLSGMVSRALEMDNDEDGRLER
jgi:APA family basic amino acid/polyamine antiporter